MNERDWRLYLDDMIGFAENVLTFTTGFDQARFESTDLNYDATLRKLELMGVAANYIPIEVRDANPAIPWRMVIATTNKLINAELGIDNDTLWSIIQDDVPALLDELKKLKSQS